MSAVLGICGRMGAGKSSLAGLLAREGLCEAVEVDDLRRHALWASDSPRHVAMRVALAERMGLATTGPTAALDRSALADRTFASPGGILAFRKATAAVLLRDAALAVSATPAPKAVVWAMLVEDGYAAMLHGPIVVVTCDEGVALRRAAGLGERDGSSLPGCEARRRLRAQASDPRRIAEARATGRDVVVVDGGRGLGRDAVEAIRAALHGAAP